MKASIKEFYQIKQELEQMLPPGFKVEFCHIWDNERKLTLNDDKHIQSVSVGKLREGWSTLWLIHIDTLEELEAFKEWKSFEPSPVAIAADDYWEEQLKIPAERPIDPFATPGVGKTCQPDGSVVESGSISHEGQDWLELKVGGFQNSEEEA